jgi:hypothetical protein
MGLRIASLGLALVAVVIPRTSFASQSAQPATELCWRPLAEVPQQGDRPAISESVLAASANDVWLTRLWSAPPLLRLSSDKWSAPEPARNGVEVWPESVGTSQSGEVAIAAAQNLDNTARVLHIARLDKGDWQWLGEPLISSPDANTHAQRAQIAFAGGQPVVAWTEAPTLAPRLYVSRWNGKSWTRLGTLNPASEDPFLTSSIAVDSKQQIWLAWAEQTELRVVRWNGSAWLDVGRDSLKAISAAQGHTMLREISLAVDASNYVWIARLASKTGAGSSAVALVRWDGTAWRDLPAPRGPAGKESTAWSVSMIVRGNVPIVAWSQAGATDNHHLFVSEWAAGDRWNALLSGLHLVEGISNVNDVHLAAGDARTLYVSWDEPGKDRRGSRLIQAYACAADEKPAAPPASTVERDTWPTTVADAARNIVSVLDEGSKARVRATKKEDLIQFHHGWGTGIRNELGLWRGNTKLLESCGGGKPVHPDSCSVVIIEAVWTLLQQR